MDPKQSTIEEAAPAQDERRKEILREMKSQVIQAQEKGVEIRLEKIKALNEEHPIKRRQLLDAWQTKKAHHRQNSRAIQLAYAYARGVPYRWVEPSTRQNPEDLGVHHLIHRVLTGPGFFPEVKIGEVRDWLRIPAAPLYAIVRVAVTDIYSRRLPLGRQAAMITHAVAEFSAKHREEFLAWRMSGNVALLGASHSFIPMITAVLMKLEIPHATWREGKEEPLEAVCFYGRSIERREDAETLRKEIKRLPLFTETPPLGPGGEV